MQRNIFFEIERDNKILEYKGSDGAPLWLFMRNSLFNLLSTIVFHDAAVQQARPYNAQMLQYMAKAMWHNFRMFFARKKASVVFYTISREVVVNQKFFNQYTDDYASLIPEDSITIEHPPLDWKWKFPRHNNKLIFSGPWLTVCSLWAKFFKQDAEKIHLLMACVKERVEQICGVTLTDEQCQSIIAETMYLQGQTKVYAKWLVRAVKRYGAKCIVMLGGSYPWYYYLNKEFKDHNIISADLQHGWISATNYVYNYDQSLVTNPGVITAAPDYYLCYGNYWAEKTNIPYKDKIAFGNPYRSNTIRNFQKQEGNKIVLIGCSRNTSAYLELAEHLKGACAGAEIIFRPHPTERLETQKLMESGKYSCQIDMGSDLYTLLSQTRILISEISTVLFESIGLIDNIFVWKTEYSNHLFPDNLFAGFATKEELLALVQDQPSHEVTADDIWDPAWKENFMRFYQERILQQEKN